MVTEITIAQRLAPEDVVPGIYVAILGLSQEYVKVEDDASGQPRVKRVSVTIRACADGQPRLVVAVCLPFVMTQLADGKREPLDVRQHLLVRLDADYALEAFTLPSPDTG